MAVNAKAIALAAKHAVPILRRQGGGVILNTVSVAAIRPRPNLAAYNASKGAALVLSKSLAIELAPDRIRVNAVCPGPGDTPMLATFVGGDVGSAPRGVSAIDPARPSLRAGGCGRAPWCFSRPTRPVSSPGR